MRVVGLIVEYNPLHNGHVYHYQQSIHTTKADAVVVIMSGHFLQRGEPALVNTWARTEMALHMGADLVIQIPYIYSTQQAKYFAHGSISILHHLPFVTDLCFGSESGDIQSLQVLASHLSNEPASFKKSIKEIMSSGQSYPSAYAQVLEQFILENNLDPGLINQPNNILGLHYLIALNQLQSNILPSTIQRQKAGYHEEQFIDQTIASATSIRKALFSRRKPLWQEIKNYMPEYTLEILQREAEEGRLVSWENFYPYLSHALLSHSPEQLEKIYEMEEGIEHRLKKFALQSFSFQSLCEQVKSKRYTWNRIQRILLHTYSQFKKSDAQMLMKEGPSYVRLLGYSEKGKQLLNKYKKDITIPLISNIRKDHPDMLDWDIKVAQLYTLGYQHNWANNSNSLTTKVAPSKSIRKGLSQEINQPPIYFAGRPSK